MPAASRVVLIPPEAWDEARLLDAARQLAPGTAPLRPGDEVAGLIVTRVEPESGSAPDARTTLEISPRPRPRHGALHLIALLDLSESMGTPWDQGRKRFEAAREALLTHIRSAGQAHASVTLITYAKTPRLAAGPFHPSALAKGTIDLGEPAGASRPAAALNAALEHAAAQESSGPQTIAWLTDGPAEVSELRLAAQRAARLGVAIHIVTFAPEADPVLGEVAQATGGSVHVAGIPLDFDIRRK